MKERYRKLWAIACWHTYERQSQQILWVGWSSSHH